MDIPCFARAVKVGNGLQNERNNNNNNKTQVA